MEGCQGRPDVHLLGPPLEAELRHAAGERIGEALSLPHGGQSRRCRLSTSEGSSSRWPSMESSMSRVRTARSTRVSRAVDGSPPRSDASEVGHASRAAPMAVSGEGSARLPNASRARRAECRPVW